MNSTQISNPLQIT